MPESSLRLSVLGHTELHGAGEGAGVALIQQPKRLALLAYLALVTADGYRRRDSIVAMFWPELDQMHGRLQFRKALHALRKALGPDAIGIRGDEEVRLEPVVWCDAVAFRRHLEAREWSEALALFRGDLLDGLFPGGVGQAFDDWLAEQRRSLRLDAARAAWECSGREDLAGRRAEALVMARRAAELDAEGEESVRRYIALLDRYGDRGTALRVFADWERRLASEYGVAPAPETRWLGRRIHALREGESSETPASLKTLPWPAPESPPATVLLPASPQTDVWPRPWKIAGGLLAAAALVVIGWLVGRQPEFPGGRPAMATVAVLPFRGMGDRADERVAAALCEELTLRLERMDAITVRSAERDALTADLRPDPGAAGRRFGVAHIVDGSVRHVGPRFRLTVRLVRTDDAVTVWAHSFDADTADLYAEERLATQAADSLRGYLILADASTRDEGRSRP